MCHHEDESSPPSFDHSVNIDHGSQAEANIEDSHGTTGDDRLESSPTDLTNESSHFDTLLPSHMIPHSSSTSLDIAGSNEVSDIANSSAMILFHHVKTAFQQLHLVMKLGLSILNGLINIPGSKKMQHFAMSVISSQQV